MKGEQLPAHGGVWKAKFDVALDAAQKRGVVVLEQVRGHDHHPSNRSSSYIRQLRFWLMLVEQDSPVDTRLDTIKRTVVAMNGVEMTGSRPISSQEPSL
jgi:hypothetical protein